MEIMAIIKENYNPNINDIQEASNILNNYVDVVIVTIGKDGAILKLKNSESITQKAPIVNVIDTTCAGDCFAGSFLAFYFKTFDYKFALEQAIQTSSKSVTDFGISAIITKY